MRNDSIIRRILGRLSGKLGEKRNIFDPGIFRAEIFKFKEAGP